MAARYEVFGHYALLFTKKCKICGRKIRLEQSYRILGPPFVYPGRVATTYYVCIECYGDPEVSDACEKLDQIIAGKRPNGPPPPPPPRNLKESEQPWTEPPEEDGVLGEMMKKWEKSNAFIDGETTFVQMVENTGIDHNKRTLLLQVEFPREVDDLIQKIPRHKVRVHVVDGRLSSIYLYIDAAKERG